MCLPGGASFLWDFSISGCRKKGHAAWEWLRRHQSAFLVGIEYMFMETFSPSITLFSLRSFAKLRDEQQIWTVALKTPTLVRPFRRLLSPPRSQSGWAPGICFLVDCPLLMNQFMTKPKSNTNKEGPEDRDLAGLSPSLTLVLAVLLHSCRTHGNLLIFLDLSFLAFKIRWGCTPWKVARIEDNVCVWGPVCIHGKCYYCWSCIPHPKMQNPKCPVIQTSWMPVLCLRWKFHTTKFHSQVWPGTPVIAAHLGVRQEDHKFRPSLATEWFGESPSQNKN